MKENLPSTNYFRFQPELDKELKFDAVEQKDYEALEKTAFKFIRENDDLIN